MNKNLLGLCLVMSLALFVSCQGGNNSNSELENLINQDKACWLRSYGRGVGKPISTCPAGTEQNGALCYPLCKDGYYGVGPVCWQSCPAGFTDTGVDCLKPSSYGRGAGYALWHESECEKQNPQGCEKYGALYYPKCKDGFHNAGCCVCSPNCVDGMTDIGVSCQKGSYGRGAGTPLVCTSDQEEDAGLCYKQCNSGYKGVGPVCWGSCPAGMTSCGAMCVASSDECVDKMLQIGSDALQIAGSMAGGDDDDDDPEIDYEDSEAVMQLVDDLDIPVCSSS